MLINSPTDTTSMLRSSSDHISLVALRMGVAVPVLYYGTQIVAAVFFPGYSFMSEAASLLGSDRSTRPLIFNAGVMATGIATLVAACGYFCAFRASARTRS